MAPSHGVQHQLQTSNGCQNCRNGLLVSFLKLTLTHHLPWLALSREQIKYNKAVITYRALNNLTPDYLSELLTPLSEIHSLNLRSSENGLLHIPLSRTTIFDNSFTCSAPKLWNALPQTVRASGSLVTFKKNLKHCLNS